METFFVLICMNCDTLCAALKLCEYVSQVHCSIRSMTKWPFTSLDFWPLFNSASWICRTLIQTQVIKNTFRNHENHLFVLFFWHSDVKSTSWLQWQLNGGGTHSVKKLHRRIWKAFCINKGVKIYKNIWLDGQNNQLYTKYYNRCE